MGFTYELKMRTTEYAEHTEVKKGQLMTNCPFSGFRVFRVFRGLERRRA